MKNVFLYFHTLKHLKFKQIYYRFFYLFYKSTVPFNVKSNKIRKIESVLKKNLFIKNKHYFENNGATFLNHSVDVSGKKIWNDSSQAGLWLYNLHYFDALLSQNINQKKTAYALLERWVDENPPFDGMGWQPFPISLRIVNIIKYALSGNALSEKIKNSVYLQTRYLNKKCEYHLLGNHLFENFKALCIAGLFFDTLESQKWLKKGLRGLKKEIQAQVLSDGGHFELSPLYHCLFLEGLLDLDNIFSAYQKEFFWKNEVIKMLNWLNAMKRSDQSISYFNDASDGIAATPEALFFYAKKLEYCVEFSKEELINLSDTGYLVINTARSKMILDVADIGPDYLPGHGHADALSFELMIDEVPVFVNLGTSCYGDSARRLFERGTSAHNTVVLNKKNSSDVWGAFRVGKRARVKNIVISKNTDNLLIQAEHNGYQRIKKNILHKRIWEVSENTIKITDILNKAVHDAFAYFHLHPNCKIISICGKKIIIQLINNKKIQINTDNSFSIIENDYAESFGKVENTQSIKMALDRNNHSAFFIRMQ